MGGEEALQQIIGFDPGVKSIAISGYLRDTDIDDLKKCGFNQVLLKPYTPTQLQTVINKVLSS
jgi:CheY-like chemotaxis protein